MCNLLLPVFARSQSYCVRPHFINYSRTPSLVWVDFLYCTSIIAPEGYSPRIVRVFHLYDDRQYYMVGENGSVPWGNLRPFGNHTMDHQSYMQLYEFEGYSKQCAY